MKVTNFKVYVTRNGDGAITYTNNDLNYKIFISKEDERIKEIFDKHFNLLSSFKNRHYAIAKWIVRDLRSNGYLFKCYYNNNMNMRPIMKNNLGSYKFRLKKVGFNHVNPIDK